MKIVVNGHEEDLVPYKSLLAGEVFEYRNRYYMRSGMKIFEDTVWYGVDLATGEICSIESVGAMVKPVSAKVLIMDV